MNERMIFTNAMQKETDAERAAYLERACGGDAEMRSRIEQLIAEQASVNLLTEQASLDFDLINAGFKGTEQISIGGATGMVEADIEEKK